MSTEMRVYRIQCSNGLLIDKPNDSINKKKMKKVGGKCKIANQKWTQKRIGICLINPPYRSHIQIDFGFCFKTLHGTLQTS